MRLSDLDSASIAQYVITRKAQGAANGTVNIELLTLGRALRLACEHGRLVKVPPIRLLKWAPPRQGFFEKEQFERVCGELPPDVQVALRCAYILGWRLQSEVLTLARSQVDLERGTLRIPPGGSKNGDGRLVYLPDELKRGLAEQLERVRALEREMGRVIPWLFPYLHKPRQGERRKSFRWLWEKACRKAGCVGMLRHDLRRTAVRDLLNAGVSKGVAMKITGHRTEAVFRRYHIVPPGDLEEATHRITTARARTLARTLAPASDSSLM